MSELIDRQEMAIRYLLDDLSDAERSRVEQQFFTDDQVFEELEIAEDELIDRYVRTELSPDETRRFEKLLVSPRLSERVELARILAQKVPPPPPKPVPTPDPVPKPDPPRPWWKHLFEFASLSPGYRVAFAGALALLLVSVPIFFMLKRSRDESRRLAAEQQQREERRRIEEQTPGNEKPGGSPEQAKEDEKEQLQPPKEYPQKPEEPRRPVVGSAIPYFLNPTTGTRSGGNTANTIRIKKGVSEYELSLNVSSGDYSRYNARLENADGNEISHHNSLRPVPRRGGKYIRYPIPANELSPGTYNVHVDGITESGQVENFNDYLFRVVAR